MKAAVLGATGFVGRSLVPVLAEHMDVAAVSRRGDVPATEHVWPVAADALDPESLRRVVVGRGSAAFETIVALVDRLPVMVAPCWVGMPTQPIALVDVVAYPRGVAGHPDAVGETFDLGGPDVLTYRQVIERIGELRGRRPRIVEVPVLSPRLSSYWLHLVTPVRAGVARPLVEGLRNPTVATEARIRELVPGELLTFDAVARMAPGA